MGNTDSKVGYRKAVIELKSKDKTVSSEDETFWQQFWKDQSYTVQEIFASVTPEDIRGIREDSPRNFATLIFKCVDQIRRCMESSCSSTSDQQSVLNCVRLLTRMIPFCLEEAEWRTFFWSPVSTSGKRVGPMNRFSSSSMDEECAVITITEDLDIPVLATTLMSSLSALLFCPGFTVSQHKKLAEEAENLSSLDSCEYIWEAGVGFALSPAHNAYHDQARIEILKLLMTCFSESIYNLQGNSGLTCPNRWLEYFTSADNRHVLPLFTSLLNVTFAYDPVGYGVPYNYKMFGDSKELLVEVAVQMLIICLDHVCGKTKEKTQEQEMESAILKNMFLNYLSRIHRDDDFNFMTNGFVRLLNNPLKQSYLPGSSKKIQFAQELLILFWKCCDYNKRFMYHVLKSSVVLDILLPVLYGLNESRQSSSRIGATHLGVFILLLLSGERNFGVRLNKPYTARVIPDIPLFNGNHADLLILVFHRLITSGHSKLQPLFDCLLTIILNISPYVKSLTMVSASKLMHLFEAFSTPWFLYATANNHHLVFFILETFNNIIQYQFDGNVALVYCIVRKRALFHQLANLPIDHAFIDKTVTKKSQKLPSSETIQQLESSLNNLTSPAFETGPSELNTDLNESGFHTTLPALPGVSKLTDKTSVFDSEMNHEKAQMDLPSVSGATVEHFSQDGSTRDMKKSTTMDAGFITSTSIKPVRAQQRHLSRSISVASSSGDPRAWSPTPEWVQSWKSKLPLQTTMRLLQVLVPQVEKYCMDKNVTDETEILKFLSRGTLVGLLPVPHPILIRKYQSNSQTSTWFRNYMWGVLYLRNTNPAIWFNTKVNLFEIHAS
ncbi:hypothetical protein RvY_07624 [Ramazzottius varieornatus]|uniref:Protein HID1 n=1 Tax=Ramazzottius varieornatus TaxID=947166 RepID=A0A1D1V2U8_RAMVA|nr:hypothetical protein RvY_07624 [Ramazzottius varieornatus]